MNLAIVLVIAAASALRIILRVAVSRRWSTSNRSTPFATTICPIDTGAFRKLINPAEDDYLRRRLPPAQFRAVRRERLYAMAAYVHVVADNAAVLVRLGQGAVASGDARISGA